MKRGKSSEEVSKLKQLCQTNPIICFYFSLVHTAYRRCPSGPRTRCLDTHLTRLGCTAREKLGGRGAGNKASLYCKGKTGEEEPGNEAKLYCKVKTGEEEPGNEAKLYCKVKTGDEEPGNEAKLYYKVKTRGGGGGMRLVCTASNKGCGGRGG